MGGRDEPHFVVAPVVVVGEGERVKYDRYVWEHIEDSVYYVMYGVGSLVLPAIMENLERAIGKVTLEERFPFPFRDRMLEGINA